MYEELNDFEFTVGDESYRCPWFVAEFLSPRIAQLRDADNTIYQFKIETEDPQREFGRFLSLGWGGTIEISDESLLFYEMLSKEILNEELAAAICGGDVEIVKEKVIKDVGRRFRFGFDISREVGFIASHFCEFCDRELKELDESVLSRILMSDRLQIWSEDFLYTKIWKLVESDTKYFTLLQFVQFEFVSTDIARDFIEKGSSFVDFVDLSIWLSLGCRFIQNVSPSTSNCRVTGKALLPQGKSLQGIVS
jgi:hypothetical protein